MQALLPPCYGPIPLYINLPAEGITLLAPRKIWAEEPETALETLKTMLPQEDIKVVRKE